MSGEQDPGKGKGGAGGGAGGGKGAGDGAGGSGNAGALDAATLTALKDLPNLAKTVGQLGQGMAALNQQLAALKPKDAGGKGKKGKDAADDDEEGDPELMTNAQLLKKMAKMVEGAVKPVKEEGDAAAIEQFKKEFTAKIEAARAKHKDFDDWKDEMGALIKRSPDLEPEELYTLVRSANKKKAKELDAKLAKAEADAEGADEEGEDEGEGKKKKGPLPFGGLTPTSGRSTPGGKKLSRAEAAEDAWRQTMSGFNIH